jgi:hypothetical protein
MKSYTLRPDTFTLNFNFTLSGTTVLCPPGSVSPYVPSLTVRYGWMVDSPALSPRPPSPVLRRRPPRRPWQQRHRAAVLPESRRVPRCRPRPPPRSRAGLSSGMGHGSLLAARRCSLWSAALPSQRAQPGGGRGQGGLEHHASHRLLPPKRHALRETELCEEARPPRAAPHLDRLPRLGGRGAVRGRGQGRGHRGGLCASLRSTPQTCLMCEE